MYIRRDGDISVVGKVAAEVAEVAKSLLANSASRSVTSKASQEEADMLHMEQIKLLKADGQEFDNVKAQVQPNLIIIADGKLPVEEGDRLIRPLPNGLLEAYIILDRGFFSRGPLGAHYQAKVRKETAIRRQPEAPVVYNLHGANSRVNINSLDSSVNVAQEHESQLFEDMRKAFTQGITNEQLKADLLVKLDEMQIHQRTKSFAHHYKEFVSIAADHLSLLTPFLPALTQLLS